MKESEIILLIIVLIWVAVAIIAVAFSSRIAKEKSRIKQFVLEHSIALKTLNAINQEYTFLKIQSFDMVYAYDNYNS